MARFTVKVTITYPVTPKEFDEKFKEEWREILRLLYIAVLCIEENVSLELLDIRNERVGDVEDIVNNLRTANWPMRFQRQETINVSERALSLLQQMQGGLALTNFDSILSAAAHLAWMSYGATWIRLTKSDGTITNMKIADFKSD